MKEKKDWRQLENKFWFRKFFVRYHEKTKQDMPDTLTLCYWGQTFIKAALRWFFIERIIWIFSPFFFMWLGALALCVLDPGVSELVAVLVGLILVFGVTVLLALACYRQAEGKARLGDWIVLGLTGLALLGMLSSLGYLIARDGVEVSAKSLLDGLMLLGIIAAVLVVVGVIAWILGRVFDSRTCRRIVEFLKTFKEKHLCPIIFYPIGFKPIKFKPVKQKSK